MTVELSLSLERGRQDFTRPFSTSQTSWATRESTLLSLSAQGITGLGEVSPLPGHSPESRSTVERALKALPHRLSFDPKGLAVPTLCGSLPETGSVRFALDCAASHFACQWLARRGSPRPVLLSPPGVPPAILIDDPLDDASHGHDVLLQARRQQRYPITLKCKIGRELKRELGALSRLQSGADTRLRLDANGSLSETDLELLASSSLALEFVEEPMPLTRLGSPRSIGIPLALDESLFRAPELAEKWLESGHVKAVVLKPMILGVNGTRGWAARARKYGADVVLSHLLDGQVARSAYDLLASLLASPNLAMGLGSHPAESLWSDAAKDNPWPSGSHAMLRTSWGLP